MNRVMVFVYGVMAYLAFLVTCLYAIGWLGNFGVPTTIDGVPRVSLVTALAVNLGLLTLFAVQHSVMARQGFKRWWTQYIPKAAERSTYVLLSSVALLAMFWFWQPMGGVIWNVQDPAARVVLTGLFLSGFVIVVAVTFLINHFDLFGLRQVWLHLRGEQYTPLQFRTPGPYKYVRHPLYIGWLLAFWATPTMTVAHLVFALTTTAYILVAIQFEERDLMRAHPEYVDYRKQVPMLVPMPHTGKAIDVVSAEE
jgi:methanethiol S-methyltransferase